jgi:short-subunit dehydrogenase
MASRMTLGGQVAVITGAAGGIGEALALALAARGCDLSLIDRREPELADVAGRARAFGVTVGTLCCDLADREACARVLEQTLATHGRVALLVNNAGVALGGRFEQVAADDFAWLMRINFEAVVGLTRAFLPILRREPCARIVNVSSIFGIVAPPGQTAYCAAKFAVRGFSESLRHELEMEGSSVGVTLVHPGGVRTGIADSARMPAGIAPQELAAQRAAFQRVLRMPPQAAAARIVRGIERGEARVLVGEDAVRAAWLQRLMPVNYWKPMARELARRMGLAELPR